VFGYIVLVRWSGSWRVYPSCERGTVSLMFLNLMFMSYLSNEMYGQVNAIIITIHPYETISLFPFDFIETDALCWHKML